MNDLLTPQVCQNVSRKQKMSKTRVLMLVLVLVSVSEMSVCEMLFGKESVYMGGKRVTFFDCLRLFEIGIPDFLDPPIFEVRPESYEFRLRGVDSADRAERAERADSFPLLIGGKGEFRPVAGAELDLKYFNCSKVKKLHFEIITL